MITDRQVSTEEKETGKTTSSPCKEHFLSLITVKMTYVTPAHETFRTAISPLTNTELLCKLGREKSPAQRWARRGESGVFSLLGTFLHPAKINTRLLTELLFLTSTGQKHPSYQVAPKGGSWRDPWGSRGFLGRRICVWDAQLACGPKAAQVSNPSVFIPAI